MHKREYDAIIDTLKRYVNGENIPHSVLRVVASKALEIIDDKDRHLADAEEIICALSKEEQQ